MNRFLSFVCCAFFALAAWAKPVSIGGILYELDYDGHVGEAQVADQGMKASGNIVIPAIVKYKNADYMVTALKKDCFWGCSDLISIQLPNSIKELTEGCLYNCKFLVSVSLPDSLTSLGKRCFILCI